MKWLLLSGVLGLVLEASAFDVVIRGGRVIDGTGAPAFFADVGIRDGRIAQVGKIANGEGAEIIDATGLVIAPGFIDVHTHAEEISDLPDGHNFIRMGVTTLMLGNCGASEIDLEEYFGKIERTGVAPNVATLIGHNIVRAKAMGGSFDRPPTEEELTAMRGYVAEAMRAGAFGLSTGLIYLPGTFSKTEEIIELAKVASEFGGMYVSHMRDEALEIDSALEELFRIAREAKIRAHVSHIKLSGKSAWGRADAILGKIDAARAEGLDITQDQYVYTASSTGISQLVPEWAREGGKLKERLADSEIKQRMKDEMRSKLVRRGQEDFSYAVIAYYRQNTNLNGLNIAEAAEKVRGSRSLEEQMELILEIVSKGRPSGVFHGMSENDLETFMRHPNTMFAADSGVRRFQEGIPHPRGYGNNARVLHRYVNEKKVLRLEEAVRRMTSLPAAAFRIPERGQVREGFRADLVMFDPKEIRDKATFTDPHQFPEGIAHVLVNGTAVIRGGEPTSAQPGEVIRFKASR